MDKQQKYNFNPQDSHRLGGLIAYYVQVLSSIQIQFQIITPERWGGSAEVPISYHRHPNVFCGMCAP